MNTNCKNCSTKLVGKYCHICSQEDKNIPKFLEFISDSLSNILELDFKIIRSFKLLLFRPGALTLEYWEGKRINQTKPIRMLAFSLLLMIIASSAIDYLSDTKMENSALVGKYVSFAFLPIYAILFKFFFFKKKEYHYTHFFIFSIHLTAATAVIGTPFFIFPVILPLYAGILGFLSLIIHNIYQFLYIYNVFKEKFLKTLFVSLLTFIIDGILTMIVIFPLTFLFPDQFTDGKDFEKMLLETDKEFNKDIENIDNQIDSLTVLPNIDKNKIDSLIKKRDQIKKRGNPFRKIKEKGDQLKSKTKISF